MKKMKNKKRLGVIAMTLLLVLAVGATAGTTLAKYISSTTKKTQATVAKWGWTLTMNADNLFGDNYDENGDIKARENGNGVVVSANADHNIVAPGTHGSMTLNFGGYAEVNTIFTFNLGTINNISLRYYNNMSYYPLVWSIDGTEIRPTYSNDDPNEDIIDSDIHAEYDVEANEYNLDIADEDKLDNIDYFAAAFIKAFQKNIVVVENENEDALQYGYKDGVVSVFIPANTQVTLKTIEIAWDWAFEQDEDVMDGCWNVERTNIMDTILGYLSAGVSKENLSQNVKDFLKDYEGSGVPTDWNYDEFKHDGVNTSVTEFEFDLTAQFVQTQATSLE